MDVWAPGRINLIGEHTDYSGGLVLPAAIQVGLTIHVHKTTNEIALISSAFGAAEAFAPDGSGREVRGWARFAQAVARELHELGRPPIGMDATISSNLPARVGLSSSAALEVGIGLALCAVTDFELDPFALAGACRRAEERAVGVPCGILDHAACLLGEKNAAILLDCTSLEYRSIPIPEDAAFLIIDSGVERRLEHTGYAKRREELERALALVGATNSLDVSPDDLVQLDALSRHRLRHVIDENSRVRQFAAALEANDLPAAGRLMSASHASLRHHYDVSLPKLDKIVAAAVDCGAFGARLLGGGFGGSVLALTNAGGANGIAQAISATHASGRPPVLVRASQGAHAKAKRSFSTR
jgi:galactokinase